MVGIILRDTSSILPKQIKSASILISNPFYKRSRFKIFKEHKIPNANIVKWVMIREY